MRTIPVRTDALVLEAAETVSRPVSDYKSEAHPQLRDEATGLPLWQVRLLIASDSSIEDAVVKFPAPAAQNFALRGRVAVENLVATPYASGTGVGVALRATKVAPVVQARPQS